MVNTIHFFGDSHARVFTNINKVIRHSIDSMSIYAATTDEQNNLFNVERTGLWLFGYGEIDCRCLIYNQIVEKNRQEDEILITLFNNFYKKVSSIYSDIGFMSVMPPAAINVPGNTIDTRTFRGSDEDRLRFTLKLNFLIRNKCIEKNHIYIDLFSAVADEKGFLRKDVTTDGLHLSDFSMIPGLLAKHNLL